MKNPAEKVRRLEDDQYPAEASYHGGTRLPSHAVGSAEAHVATQQARLAVETARRATELTSLAQLKKDERVVELDAYIHRTSKSKSSHQTDGGDEHA